MATFTLRQERPIMTRQLLGRVPQDACVPDRPFVPNVPPPNRPMVEVYEEAPELDAGGGLKLLASQAQVEAEPYSPTLRAALCGLACGVAAGLTGTLTGSAVGAAVAGLALGAGLGHASARNDRLSVVAREETVTTPVMTGYRAGSVDGAWTRGRGRLHYALPIIERRPVGLARSEELRHSALSTEKAVLLSLVLGAGVGLIPVPFR